MTSTSFAQGQLRQLIDRIMRLKAEQDAIGQDIREVYKEAHASGFDKTTLGQAVGRLRKEEKNGVARLEESDAMLARDPDAPEAIGWSTVYETLEPPPSVRCGRERQFRKPKAGV